MSVRMSVYLIWNWTRWAPFAPRSSCLFWFLVFFGLLLKALITIIITFIIIHNHTAITKHTLNCTPHANKHQQTYEYTHNYTHTSKHVPQAYTYTHIHALRHFCTNTHTHVNTLTKIWFMIVKHNLGRTQAARNRRLTSSTCSSRISDTRSSTSRRRLTGQTRPIINNIRRISTNNSFLKNENVALASSLKPAAVRNLEPRSNSSYRGHYEKEIEVYKVNLFGGRLFRSVYRAWTYIPDKAHLSYVSQAKQAWPLETNCIQLFVWTRKIICLFLSGPDVLARETCFVSQVKTSGSDKRDWRQNQSLSIRDG